MPGTRALHRLANARGQSVIEFAIVMPIVVVLVLGVLELGYALQDQHLITKLTREGSNLISRDTTVQDAATALRAMSSAPVNFDNGSSRLILSVIKRGATTGSTNYDKMVLYQRFEYGALAGTSQIQTRGGGSFGGPPDYEAAGSDSNANLQVTNLPANLVSVKGGMIYVTEIYTRHTLLTPLTRFGINVPQTLYSIAYF
ncbi:MAG: TadE/TadG family type IV pilus assembly protein [Acidobacteriota bacterium]